MRALIISIIIAMTAFSFFLKYLNYLRRNDPIPENVKDVFDEETYKKSQAYRMDNLKLSIVEDVFGTIVSLVFMLLNLHHALFEYISTYTNNIYLTSLFILLIPSLISSIITQPFDIYDTFVIEERYGFNKTTPKTFILDFFKTLLLGFAITSGVFALFIFIYGRIGDWVFLAFFFVLLAFQLFVTFISPLLIRIFNKLTPIEEGELKEKIEHLAATTGYKLKGIYMVDASRRSTSLNAFATGFGKTKTIGLYDTLLDKMTDDEIVSILAHEIGHTKKRHIIKSAPLGVAQLIVVMIAAYFLVTMPEVSQAFGFTGANMAFGVFAMLLLISPILAILGIPSSALSRKHEFEADAFEKEHSGKEVAVSALKKLYREDLGNLTPHPLVVKLSHSHPTLSQRVEALEMDHD